MKIHGRARRNDKIFIDNKRFDHKLEIKLIIAKLDLPIRTFNPAYSTYDCRLKN